MFTLEQIEQANAKVRSGDDFPRLAQELADMGVATNVFHVVDGRAEYLSADGHSVETSPTHGPQAISGQQDDGEFLARLRTHQAGETDFPIFLKDAAETGIEKWVIDLAAMTCTYFDADGNAVLVEQIPQV